MESSFRSPGSEPLVTVVTPCHNAAAYVGETIESVLKQTHAPVEHVVVDDGSTDGSWEVIREWAERHPERIRAERVEENRGGSHARNLGAAQARGEYLMFLDADDLVSAETVGSLVEAARREQGALAVCEWKRLRRGEGGEWEEAAREVPLPPSGDPDGALRGWIEGVSWSPTGAILWPREVYEATGGWDEELSLNDDGDLMMRALAAGTRLIRSDRGCFLYRDHAGAHVSVSQSFVKEEKLRSQLRVIEKLRSELAHQGRLASFSPSLAVALHQAALVGFQNGHLELARDCQRRGEALGGGRVVSRTLPGRVLVRLLGLERKERLVQALGRLGLRTRARAVNARLRAPGVAPREGERR